MAYWRSNVPTPTKHDHVGHMKFYDTEARCTGCGQTWKRVTDYDAMGKPRYRWVPIVSEADDNMDP